MKLASLILICISGLHVTVLAMMISVCCLKGPIPESCHLLTLLILVSVWNADRFQFIVCALAADYVCHL